MKILVATTNMGKLRELTALLGDIGCGITWLTLKDVADIPEVVEDGATFTENAHKKACGYAKATGLWTLADDSGLVVDALGGEPGVYSARYAAEEYSSHNRRDMDAANYQKVLDKLREVPDDNRTARFVCHLCLASPDSILLEATGTVEGVIGHHPIGDNGFGYDPVFYIPALQKTAAELGDEQKNQISHRGNAIRNFKPLFERLLTELA